MKTERRGTKDVPQKQDLKEKLFELSNARIQWVEAALADMSLEEKISQLFVLLKPPVVRLTP